MRSPSVAVVDMWSRVSRVDGTGIAIRWKRSVRAGKRNWPRDRCDGVESNRPAYGGKKGNKGCAIGV